MNDSRVNEWTPMPKDEIIKIIEAHNELSARTLDIIDKPPFNEIVSADFAELSYDDEKPNTVTVRWCYEEPYEGTYAHEFDISLDLLTMTKDGLTAWREGQQRAHAERAAKYEAQQIRDAEAKERALYERLKAKYEGSR